MKRLELLLSCDARTELRGPLLRCWDRVLWWCLKSLGRLSSRLGGFGHDVGIAVIAEMFASAPEETAQQPRVHWLRKVVRRARPDSVYLKRKPSRGPW